MTTIRKVKDLETGELYQRPLIVAQEMVRNDPKRYEIQWLPGVDGGRDAEPSARGGSG